MKNIGFVKRTLVMGMMLMAGVTAMWAGQDNTTTEWTPLTGSKIGETLSSGTYYIAGNVTYTNFTAGGSGITIANNATVHIYIPAGCTLTATGANASGTTGGGAGIYIPSNATLYLHGSGTVNATGGNAANGENGKPGNSYKKTSHQFFGHENIDTYGGAGGNGGNGGGGAGAGIGTNGGYGGNGGNGGSGSEDRSGRGTQGGSGTRGSSASDMGTLFCQNGLSISATGGAAGSNGNNGNTPSDYDDGDNKAWSGSGGGGGAGGKQASGIGTGGGGGYGGYGGGGGNDYDNSARYEATGDHGATGRQANGSTTNIISGNDSQSKYVLSADEVGDPLPILVPAADPLTGSIACSGVGYEGSTDAVNFNVSSITAGNEGAATFTLPELTGRKWSLTTYGYPCGPVTSDFAQDNSTLYEGGTTITLTDVYGNLIFTTYANEHTVTPVVTAYRGDNSETTETDGAITIEKSQDGGTTYVDGLTMVQCYDKVKLTFGIEGYYLESYTISGDVSLDAENTFIMPDVDVTVTATYREKYYPIIYDAASAGMSILGQTKYHLTDLTLSSVQPTKTGFTFLGWSRTQDATTADFAPGSLAGDGLNGTNHGDNVSLFAVWKASDYSVTIDPSICGGTVTAPGSAQYQGEVALTIEMDEGYTGLNELYYTVDGSTDHVAIDQGTKKFQMPAGNVTVFASFRGEFTLVQDASLTQDETLTEGELYIGKTLLGSADIGRKVKLTVKSNADKKLKSITYQKVTGTNVMRARNRVPSAGDVPIEGPTTVAADDPSVSYFSEQGVYVATINNVDGNLRVSAKFEDKTDLTADGVTVALQGVAPTYMAGSAPDDSGWNATVNGAAQERDVDVSLTYTMNNGYNVGSQGSITVTALPNNKDYKGSMTFSSQFTMVKTAPANYTIDAIPSAEYTGSAITPTVTVKKDGTTMDASGYDLSYSNNINVGTAMAQVKVNDPTDGECYVTQTFLITRKNLELSMTAVKTITYGDDLTGNPTEVTATTLAATDLLAGITFSAPSILVGDHELTLSGAVVNTSDGTQYRTDSYNITYTAGTLTINPKAATLTANDQTITYGDPVPANGDYSVSASGLQYSDQLTANPTLSTTYTRGSDVGTYPITCGTDPTVKAGETDVTNCYSFAGTGGTLTVQTFDLRNATIVVTDNEKGYNGSALTATVKVWTAPEAEGGYDITADCEIWYGDENLSQTVAAAQTVRGAYPITVKPATGNTNVTGQKEADESLVIGVKNISDQTGDTYDVGLTGAAQTYTGSVIEPTLADITVTYLGNDLTADQKTAEFEITDYANNLNVGTTATVSLIGKNVNFSGSRTTSFEITAADLSTAVSTATYATTVRAEDVSGGNVRTVTPSANIIMMPYQGVPFQLKAEDVEVWLTGGSNKLPVADYALKYKKGGVTYDNIDDIGTFTVVIVAGTSGNTTDAYETALTVETQREIVLTKNEWVTYYDGTYDLQKPEGYEVYYVTAVNNVTREVSATPLDYIPKDVPLLLHRLATTYGTDFSDDAFTVAVTAWTGATVSPSDISDISYNFWGIGSTEAAHAKTTYGTEDNFTDYIIVKSLFVKAEPNTTVEMHRCFLRVANNTSSPARSYYSIAVDDDATGISGNASNGLGAEKWYDLQGNRINKPTRKGVYIKNGTKVVIK